jgi:hypothetical protein
MTIERVWFGNRFTDHLYIQLKTTSNYSTTANLHTSQITTAFFHPAVSSAAVPWQRLLTVEILQLHTLRFSLHSLPCRTQLNSQLTLSLAYNISAHTTQKHHFNCYSPTVVLLKICCLAMGTCLLSQCPEMLFTESLVSNRFIHHNIKIANTCFENKAKLNNLV